MLRVSSFSQNLFAGMMLSCISSVSQNLFGCEVVVRLLFFILLIIYFDMQSNAKDVIRLIALFVWRTKVRYSPLLSSYLKLFHRRRMVGMPQRAAGVARCDYYLCSGSHQPSMFLAISGAKHVHAAGWQRKIAPTSSVPLAAVPLELGVALVINIDQSTGCGRIVAWCPWTC